MFFDALLGRFTLGWSSGGDQLQGWFAGENSCEDSGKVKGGKSTLALMDVDQDDVVDDRAGLRPGLEVSEQEEENVKWRSVR
jgi:hypothetical protein